MREWLYYWALLHHTRWVGSWKNVPVMKITPLFKLGSWLDAALHVLEHPDKFMCYHTHPSWSIRVVLWNGYVEELEDGTLRAWRAGDIGIVAPSLAHRVEALLGDKRTLTLFIRFKKVADVKLVGSGWL